MAIHLNQIQFVFVCYKSACQFTLPNNWIDFNQIWYALAGLALMTAVFVGGYVTGAIMAAGVRVEDYYDSMYHQEDQEASDDK